MLERRVVAGLNAEVSAIGAGCWTIGGPAINRGVPIGWDNVDADATYAGLVRAHELGITLYDTADVYGLGQSERLLGRLLHGVPRDDLVICSKVGYFAGTARHPYHPAQIRSQLAITLDNLGTDHLDVYFLHSLDFGDDDHYLPGAVDLMRGLRDQGVIQAIGMRAPHSFAEQWATSSRPEAPEIHRWLHLFGEIQPDVVTARYNLLSPLYAADETHIFSFTRRHGVGVLIKQALGQGSLLRCHHHPPQFSASDHRSTDPTFSDENWHSLYARLAPIRARVGDDPTALARLCQRYALQHAPDAAVLVGFRDATQIHTNVTCLGDPLDDEEIIEIRAPAPPGRARRLTERTPVQYVEVEKKFALSNPDALKSKLDQLGAKSSEPIRQIDEYYNAPHRDFLAPQAISEWLRIRTEDRGASINYKCWHPIAALVKTHADEYESVVADVEAVRRLLQALDFRPLITVDKTREEWTVPDIEIVFDHVVGAGHFVEFEFKGDANNIEDATTRLLDFIATLDVDLGEPINRGYPHILLGREH